MWVDGKVAVYCHLSIFCVKYGKYCKVEIKKLVYGTAEGSFITFRLKIDQFGIS